MKRHLLFLLVLTLPVGGVITFFYNFKIEEEVEIKFVDWAWWSPEEDQKKTKEFKQLQSQGWDVRRINCDGCGNVFIDLERKRWIIRKR